MITDLEIGELSAMMHAGRYGELEATLREVIREHPLHGLAWKAFGVSLRMQGKDALAALQTAMPGSTSGSSRRPRTATDWR